MKLLGQDILPMGMGCWAIGGAFFSGTTPLGFPDVDDAESIRTIRATLDAGNRANVEKYLRNIEIMEKLTRLNTIIWQRIRSIPRL